MSNLNAKEGKQDQSQQQGQNMSESGAKKVSVQCLNEEVVVVEPGHILMRCETLKRDVLQRLGKNDPEPIVVSKIDSEVMREIVEYCRVHWRAESDEQDLQPRIGRRQLNEYVQKFVSQKDANSLFSFIVAADHLKVSDLLDVLCEEVANRYIKGKTPEEIRYHLNIKNDWAEDEDERVLQVIESFQKGEQEDKNYSMLHQLALEGDEPIVSVKKLLKALLDKGEDLNARESKDLTPLDMAAMMGHHHLLDEFVKLGAQINSKDKTGKSALHKAAQNGKTKCVERLIQIGCDKDALDNDGFAAVHYAAMAGSLETMVAMAKLGCNYKIRAQGPLMSGCSAAAMYCMQRREVYKEGLVEGRLARAAEEFRQSQNQSNNKNNSPKGKKASQNSWSLEQVLQDLEPPNPQADAESKKVPSSKKKKKKRKMAKQEHQKKQQQLQQNGLQKGEQNVQEDKLQQQQQQNQNFSTDEDLEEGEGEGDEDDQAPSFSNQVQNTIQIQNGIDNFIEFASQDIVNVAKQQQSKILKQQKQQELLSKKYSLDSLDQSWSIQNQNKLNSNSIANKKDNDGVKQINSLSQQHSLNNNFNSFNKVEKQKNGNHHAINQAVNQKDCGNSDIVLENYGAQIAQQRFQDNKKLASNCSNEISELEDNDGSLNQLQTSQFHQQFQTTKTTSKNQVPINGVYSKNSEWPQLSKQKVALHGPQNGKTKSKAAQPLPPPVFIPSQNTAIDDPLSHNKRQNTAQNCSEQTTSTHNYNQNLNQSSTNIQSKARIQNGRMASVQHSNLNSNQNNLAKAQYAVVASTSQQQHQQQQQQQLQLNQQQQLQSQQKQQQQQDLLNEDFPPLSCARQVKSATYQNKDQNNAWNYNKSINTNNSNNNCSKNQDLKSNLASKVQTQNGKVGKDCLKNQSDQSQKLSQNSQQNEGGYFSLFSHQIVNRKQDTKSQQSMNTNAPQHNQLQSQIICEENINDAQNAQKITHNPDINLNISFSNPEHQQISAQQYNLNSNHNLDSSLSGNVPDCEVLSKQRLFSSKGAMDEPLDQLINAGLKYGYQNDITSKNNISSKNMHYNNVVDPSFGKICKFYGEAIFLCPISQRVMKEPVIAADGHTYDLDSIWQWLTTNNTSPVSGEVLLHKKLVPNLTLKQIILSLVTTQQL